MPDDDPVRVLGRRLDAARRQRGWTFREFAEHTGMSKSTLQYLIRTRRTAPDYYELVALVGKLGQPWTEEWERLWRRAVDGTPSDPEAVPAQLPAAAPGFVGRDAELAELGRVRDAGAALVVLCGMAGVGKTALAVRWAHRVREEFADGQLYLDLRGYDPDPPLPAADAMASLLRALGVRDTAMPSALDDRGALLRTVTHGKRLLVVLDNAATVEQVRPLLTATDASLTLVTSRDRLAGLVAREGAVRVELDPLPVSHATGLLTGLIGARASTDRAALASLAEHCARLPLALRVAAEFVAGHPGTPLPDLVAELADEQRRLDALDAGGDRRTAIRGVLSWSYRHLPAPTARMFRLLGLHGAVGFCAAAAAALAGLPAADARPLLDRLCQAYLIRPAGADRYQMHDLLRAYASELVLTVDTRPQRRAAVRRLLTYYLHSAHAAALRLEPHRLPITLPRARAVTPERPASTAAALAWFTTEHPALLAAINLAIAGHLDAYTWRLAWTLLTFFERRGHWQDYAYTQRAALAATERLGDRSGQAHTHRCLARVHSRLGRCDEADAHLRRALELYREAGDRGGQARTCLNLSMTAERGGRYLEAMDHDREAYALFVAAGDRHGQGLALNQIGCDHLLLGNPDQALVDCGRALAVFEEFGDVSSQAAVWDSLGAAHHALRRTARAVACYEQAIARYRQLGNRYHEADSLIHLGETHEASGDRDAALAHWKLALEILDELHHGRADEIRARLAAR
ncbi:tetratricopeptide repeat protein [Streptomyces odontomachi]|uniref:tetratricopeptide repeat protein n=1 Tax=Streptomyces odontomachi TaxID=2944940 RepID=UPI00210BAE3B|nr:tetratricopeptide repeat protein [Streptomyces sp. ODS25]